ncbi:MAG: response regulator transcription factor [Christensenellaceae bacterium]
MKPKLLLIEDDETLLREMTAYFSGCYDVYAAASLAAAQEYLADNAPDAAVLDLILPDGNGLSLLTANLLSGLTVILTTMDADDDHAEGLDAGAKDYLIKPVSLRISQNISPSASRRNRKSARLGKPSIDTNKRTVSYAGKPVSLTSTEFNLLVYLFNEADNFHTAQEIYTAVYGELFLQSTAIKMHLSI